MPKRDPLSRREREIMDIVYRNGQATAGEILDVMADPPSYSAVRATLSVLERKGHLRHEDDGTRYVYKPTVNRDRAKASALDHLVATFFDGSVTSVVAALLERPKREIPKAELDELVSLIEQARKEGR
ncbi:MAG: BlaI/MecI/CopY family transcriptional regulator [Acidobacteria bacterium]|nr:BlaI/MecI/CopY family transcriptional regulator [Acidobacteriota bacterium]